MKGSIRQRSPGSFEIRIEMAPGPDGRRRQRSITIKANGRREAQLALAKLLTEAADGELPEPSKTTLAQYLRHWADHHMTTQVDPRTVVSIGEKIANINSVLGGTPLTKLKPEAVNAAYARLLANGRRDGKGGLSQRSVHHCHRILFQALGQAVKWKLLKSNPMLAVDAPAVAAVEMTTLTDDQLATALSAMQETRFLVPFLLGVMCGLRRGKICALKWKYVDLERGTLQVTASARQIKTEVTYKRPKDGKAGRSVELPPLVVEELRAHRRRQIEEQLKLGIRLGADSFVVAQPDGAPLKPSSLTNEWRRLSVKHRLPRIRFHDLRHTHASQLLASGVHPKVAQERLGHSTIAITLDLYSHMMPNTQADAAVAVDNRLRAAISKRAKDGS